MGSKFPLITLDMIAEVIDSRHKTPNYTESGYPMVRVVDIKGGELDLKDTKRVTKDIYEDFSKGRSPQTGDLVISRVGSYGNISYVSGDEKFCLGQNTAFIIPNEKNNYLYYALISPFVQQQIEDMAVGAVQKTISLKSIKNLNIPFPHVDIRNAISKIMRNIDTRISINNKINIQLEQMSQTLFKSWFVDFDPVIDNALDAGNPIPEALQSRAELRQKVRNSADFKPLPADIRALFPAEFEETELGWVPKGWQTKSVHNLVESVSITFPLSKTDKVIFLNTGDIEKGSFLHQNYSKTEGLPGQAKKSIKKGDILFSEIRPENKRYAFVHFESDDYVVSTKLMVLRAKNEIHPLLPYFIITLEDNTKKLQRIAELRSGTFPQITFKELEFISFIMPNNDEIMELFINSYLAPAYNKIIETKKANINLINLRDTLLPKLISGELSLEDLPDLVDQTEPA